MPYRLDVYVPEEAVNTVKEALFAAGAGKIGNYDCCCYTIKGVGQFRPLPGSNPVKGNLGSVCVYPEDKLEVIVADNCIDSVIEALLRAHPYETPAFQYWKVNS
ncbi:Nif3-related protein [Giardia lamblia P15]|uniref:Nif3-related protein n=1 Tax=Giardia intestinalis (strain P15) TaxID=658858 RepID=E1F0V3_GIAIA|nr:Nif3-related protein [Giardia lamblia P15]